MSATPTLSDQNNRSTTERVSGGMTRRAVLLSLAGICSGPPSACTGACDSHSCRRVAPGHASGVGHRTLSGFLPGTFRSAGTGPSWLDNPHADRGRPPAFWRLTEAGQGPPRIDHFGMAVEDFDVDQLIEILAPQGVTRSTRSTTKQWTRRIESCGNAGAPDDAREHSRNPYG